MTAARKLDTRESARAANNIDSASNRESKPSRNDNKKSKNNNKKNDKKPGGK